MRILASSEEESQISGATGGAGLNKGGVTPTEADHRTVRATVFGKVADVENKRLDWESQISGAAGKAGLNNL